MGNSAKGDAPATDSAADPAADAAAPADDGAGAPAQSADNLPANPGPATSVTEPAAEGVDLLHLLREATDNAGRAIARGTSVRIGDGDDEVDEARAKTLVAGKWAERFPWYPDEAEA